MLHPRFGIKLSRFVKNYTVFSLNYPVFLSRFVSKTTLGACRQSLVPRPDGGESARRQPSFVRSTRPGR